MSLNELTAVPADAITARLCSPPVAADAQHQQDLEDFFHNANVGLHLVGPDGTILSANKAELDMLGYDASEYIGHNITEFHADEPVISDILRRLTSGERLDKYPARLRAKDGSIRDVLITSSAQFRDGKFINTRCITLDVTETKKANDLIREQNQRFAATYDHAEIAITEVDAEGRRLRVNKAACEILGRSRVELVGTSPYDIMMADDGEHDRDQHRRLMAGEIDRYTALSRYTRPDGKVIWIDLMGSAVRDAQGRVLYSVRVFRDVTAAKAATEKLRDSEHRFRQLIEALPAAVYTTDPNGRITYYNQAAVELSGREPKIGSDQWCVTWKLSWPNGAPLPHDECPMAVTLKEGRPVRGLEAVAERPDGTKVPFIPYPTPLHDETGAMVGAVNMLVDISERKQSEANQKVLLDELNHRVKNNMQMLHSLLRTAQRETDDTQARAVLANATDRIGAMAAAQQVLYDAGATMGYKARQFLEAVCDSARQAVGKNIRLDVADCDVEMLSNDTAMPLALIIHELIINAAKHGINGRGEGSIRVGLTRNGKSYSLSVEDDGPGFVLEQVRKRSSGLGLVFGLARQLGGTVRVEKEAGARCVVEFAETGL
jgi:PAS domain S-box-containing protein